MVSTVSLAKTSDEDVGRRDDFGERNLEKPPDWCFWRALFGRNRFRSSGVQGAVAIAGVIFACSGGDEGVVTRIAVPAASGAVDDDIRFQTWLLAGAGSAFFNRADDDRVACWSVRGKTGISIPCRAVLRSRCTVAREMSSRLMPPKVGARLRHESDDLLVSWVSRPDGKGIAGAEIF